MTQGSTVRDELHTLTLDTVTPTQLKTAIGKVYIGPVSEIATQNDCNQIVTSYQSVHTPTMGASIPGTGVITEATAIDATVFTIHKPAAGETFKLNAAQLINSHGAAISTVALVFVNAGGKVVAISKVEGAAPSTAVPRYAFGIKADYTYDENTWIGAIVEVGTATDQTVSIASIKVVQ
jgi:hypothetical protein